MEAQFNNELGDCENLDIMIFLKDVALHLTQHFGI